MRAEQAAGGGSVAPNIFDMPDLRLIEYIFCWDWVSIYPA